MNRRRRGKRAATLSFDGVPQVIRGEVVRVFFSNHRFTTGLLVTDDAAEWIRFAGEPSVEEGESVALTGRWTDDAKWGRQFRVQRQLFELPNDEWGLVRYLAYHPEIKGIGMARAQKIVTQFGAGQAFERALAERPGEVAAVAGVDVGIIENLRAHWQATADTNALRTWLASFDLTHRQIEKIVSSVGYRALRILQSNPYELIGLVEGFGFHRVDKVAQGRGISKEHPGRIQAGLVHVVKEALDDGHCWVEITELVEAANKLIRLDDLDSRKRIEAQLDELLSDGEKLVAVDAGGRGVVALPAIRSQEAEIEAILEDAAGERIGLEPDVEAAIASAASKLDPWQLQAVRQAFGSRVSLVSGGAGSGKTYAIARIAEIQVAARQKPIVLCAPTGKAAKRIEESIRQATGLSLEAKTIHRLLGFNGDEYAFGPDRPLSADLIIVDEMSMVDVRLMWRLLTAIDFSATHLVLVGDHNQLPPVGPGNVLRDLLARKLVPATVLEHCHRQAGLLKRNCAAILEGVVAPRAREEERLDSGRLPWNVLTDWGEADVLAEAIVGLYESVLAERMGFDVVKDVQLLTAMHQGPLGTVNMNRRLQALIQFRAGVGADGNGRARPMVGDRVIQTKNDYDIEVMNGSTGVVVASESDLLVVDFEDRGEPIEIKGERMENIELAYALTVHKAQGSEYPCVIVECHKSQSIMTHRNWLYTACTRARECAILCGDAWGVRACAKRVEGSRRRTFLSLGDLRA